MNTAEQRRLYGIEAQAVRLVGMLDIYHAAEDAADDKADPDAEMGAFWDNERAICAEINRLHAEPCAADAPARVELVLPAWVEDLARLLTVQAMTPAGVHVSAPDDAAPAPPAPSDETCTFVADQHPTKHPDAAWTAFAIAASEPASEAQHRRPEAAPPVSAGPAAAVAPAKGGSNDEPSRESPAPTANGAALFGPQHAMTPARQDCARALLEIGTAWADILQCINRMPGSKIGTVGTLQNYCYRLGMHVTRERRQEAGRVSQEKRGPQSKMTSERIAAARHARAVEGRSLEAVRQIVNALPGEKIPSEQAMKSQLKRFKIHVAAHPTISTMRVAPAVAAPPAPELLNSRATAAPLPPLPSAPTLPVPPRLPDPASNGRVYATFAQIRAWSAHWHLAYDGGNMDAVNRLRAQFRLPEVVQVEENAA